MDGRTLLVLFGSVVLALLTIIAIAVTVGSRTMRRSVRRHRYVTPAPTQTQAPPQQTGAAQPPPTGTGPARTRWFGWGTVTAVVVLALVLGGLAIAWFSGAFAALATQASVVWDWASAFLAQAQGAVRRTVPSGVTVGDIQLDAWLPTITTGLLVALPTFILLLLLRSVWKRAVRRASARAATPGMPPATPGSASAALRVHRRLSSRFGALLLALVVLSLSLVTGVWQGPYSWIVRGSPPSLIPEVSDWAMHNWVWLLLLGGLTIWLARLLPSEPKAKDAAAVSVAAAFAFLLVFLPAAWKIFYTVPPSIASAIEQHRQTPPPEYRGQEVITVPALGRSGSIIVPHGKRIEPKMPPWVKLKCLIEDGRMYTAWEDWPKNAAGHYLALPIRHCFFQNIENRSAVVRYFFTS